MMHAVLLLKALSPITHGSDTAGNRALIRREKVDTPLGVRDVPVITGNSLRRRAVREPAIESLSREGGLTKERLRWLYSGGALDKDDKGRFKKITNVDAARIARCYELFPHVEALGCAMPDSPIPGKLKFGIAWLASMETQDSLRDTLPESWFEGANPMSPCHEWISDYDYYRHDPAKAHAELLTDEDREALENESMPHGGENVIPGAAFVATLHAPGLSDLAASALFYSLETWAEAGPTVGGQSARGHGRVQPYLWTDREIDSSAYRNHLTDRVGEMREFIDSLY